ncbi:MAG: tetraacyldisaccharide 4'-kinase [Proteobacteria bacterium]|nr:tetraacyldisaccharide 4'-kinase [Pseudomonadota bacterium]
MRNTIVKIWEGEAKYIKWILYIPLFLLSSIYKICLVLRESMYRIGLMKVDKVAIPVISVGNITLGGTGKTPVVEKLSTDLKKMGFKPGIVTRGYRRKRKGIFHVDTKNDSARDVGDEAMMLAKRVQMPVIVGNNRGQAIDRGIKEFNIDIALLDDGFQLRNIRKDIEVLILNGAERKRNNGLFPLGPFREPLMRIKDADIILVNKGNLDSNTRAFAEGKPTFKVKYKPAYLYNLKENLITHYNFLNGKSVLAFSGLGDNRSFFHLLTNIGARIVHEISYPDHYVYRKKDIEKLSSFEDVEAIVTTEKDAVKIAHMDVPANLFYLSIEVHIEREEELLELIREMLKTRDNA